MKFLLPGLASAILAITPVAAATPVVPADLHALSLVTDPVVAPEGRRVLFTRAAFDRGLDRRTTELWLAHLDETGRVIDRRLLVGRDLAPRQARFSPDGSRIVFVGQSMGRAQLHLLTLADGIARPLTDGELSPSQPRWSPDGRRIAFTGRIEGKPVPIPGLPDRPAGAEQAPDPKIVDDLFWRQDGVGERKAGATHLFVTDAASGAVTRLTSGERDAVNEGGGLAWTPDGRSIIAPFTADPVNGPREIDLWRYPASGSGKPQRLTSRPGSEYAPEVSPDGRTVAFLGSAATADFYDMPELWTAPLEPDAPVRHLSAALDRPVAGHVWRADSQALHILYHDRGVQRVAELDATSGATRVLVPEVGGTRLYLPSAGGGFSSAGGTIAYTSSFTDRPAGLGISKGTIETGAVDFNAQWAASRRPARIEEVIATSRADGRAIQGWVAYPPDFDRRRRYPLILDIHGGPNTDYGPFFSITHALYAAAGYIVLFTNPRGSIGYGRAFANAITNAYPGQDHDDLMSMVDVLAARPYVNTRNLFIGGGSGGGVLTLWAIGQEPDRFRAAVALRPVTDWTNQVTTSDSPAFFMKHWMGAAPWDQPDLYVRRSPFSLAGRIRTPTLFITGEQDFRTPISQTEQMFGALKLRGIDTRMIRLPGASHGMGRPSQWLQSILAPIDWFERYRVK